MMFRRNLILLLVLSLLTPLAFNNAYAEKVMKLKLIRPVEINQTIDVDSSLVELNQAAREYGLHNVTIYGSVQYEGVDKTKSRTKINWHTVGMQSGSKEITQAIPSGGLNSKVVSDENLPPGFILKATGDMQALAQALQALKDKQEENPVAKEEKTENDIENTTIQPGTASPSGTASYGSGTNLPKSEGIKAKITNSSYEKCPPRADIPSELVYLQHKELKKEGTEVVSTGQCIDTGASMPLQKVKCGTESNIDALEVYDKYRYFYYSEGKEIAVAACAVDKKTARAITKQKKYGDPCPMLFDYTMNKATVQYREIVIVDGVETPVSECKADPAKTHDISETNEGCSPRHDLESKKTYEQTKKQYRNDQGELITITQCSDSTSTDYVHELFQTTNTCNWKFDDNKNLAFAQKRWAYTAQDGTEQYATPCEPVGAGVAVQEETCTPKYEHDMIAGQSYLMTRKYYMDGSKKTYVTQCQRSSTTSYPIQFDPTGCNHDYNDQALTMVWRKKAFIEPEGEHVDIGICEPVGAPEPYIYSTDINQFKIAVSTSTSWTTPKGVESVEAHIIGEGNKGWPGPGTQGVTITLTGASGEEGQQIHKTFSATPLQTYPISFRGGNATFMDNTARKGGGLVRGGGWKFKNITYGNGGVGGKCSTYLNSSTMTWTSSIVSEPEEGGPAAVILEWKLKKYVRPDGTYYLEGGN